jgi:hypothetical protein
MVEIHVVAVGRGANTANLKKHFRLFPKGDPSYIVAFMTAAYLNGAKYTKDVRLPSLRP